MIKDEIDKAYIKFINEDSDYSGFDEYEVIDKYIKKIGDDKAKELYRKLIESYVNLYEVLEIAKKNKFPKEYINALVTSTQLLKTELIHQMDYSISTPMARPIREKAVKGTSLKKFGF